MGEYTSINQNKMCKRAIDRITHKINHANTYNKNYKHNIVVDTEVTDEYPEVITMVNKHFADQGFLINHINKSDCFRIRWDRNMSQITRGIRRSNKPNSNKVKKVKPTKDLGTVMNEINEEIDRKANLGYFECKYHSKFAIGHEQEIINKYTREGFSVECHGGSIYLGWRNPNNKHASSANMCATNANINIACSVIPMINDGINKFADYKAFAIHIGCHSIDTINNIIARYPNIYEFKYDRNGGTLRVTWR